MATSFLQALSRGRLLRDRKSELRAIDNLRLPIRRLIRELKSVPAGTSLGAQRTCGTLRRTKGVSDVKRLRIEQDVQPVSAFRANAAKLIEQVQSHKRALVLTQRGRSAAVVLDPGEYDRLIETLELLQDVHEANAQIATGKGVAEKKAKEALLRRSMK